MQWQMVTMSIKKETKQDKKETQAGNTITEVRMTLDGPSEEGAHPVKICGPKVCQHLSLEG